MTISLDAKTWKEIDTLIRKALEARETYRPGPRNARTMSEAWKPIMRLIAKFPDGTFTKNKHEEIADINPYGTEVLTALTECIWAFSLGPVLDDLDCPQTATDLYSYFGQDLYQVWYHSEQMETKRWASLFRDVTNDVADYRLITTDTAPRQGLTNSPRAAMAAHAWVITNAMSGSDDIGQDIADRAKRLWESRCGPFVVAWN
ncbi:hypothetical protein FLONG3_2476 [Fusarium longipes]|uniref:Uncharacterized protein n=1 Tax=Fusarium longipes TaxID=694270 RepID=A0A395T432_9HYPO|nr:hypothetical protein FLONG3_2476 [Fusarium longipes]